MADNHTEDQRETVVEALGLELKWADKNIETLKEFYDDDNGTISELIIKLGLATKEDIFGKLTNGAENLSEYELKLLYSGFQVAKFMQKERAKMTSDILGSPFGNPFGGGHPLLDMLKGLSGSGMSSGAIRVKMGEDGKIEEIEGGNDAPGPIKDIIKDIIDRIKRDHDSKNGND